MHLSEPLIDLRAAWREAATIAAITAIVVAVAAIDRAPFAIAIAAVAVIAAAIVAVAATPAAAGLTIDAAGVELRVMGLWRRRIPWSAVGAIEVAEGWSGETVTVELRGSAGEGAIPGLPIDPTLRRRAFASTWGLAPQDLRDRLVAARDGGHP